MTHIARRRLVAPLRIAIVLLVLATGCAMPMHQILLSRKPVSATGVTLSQTTLSLVKDGTSQLIATVKPQNATDKRVLWSSEDKTLATVSGNGLVTAIGSSGTVKVKAVTVDGQFVATCDVLLNAFPVPLVSIAIHQASLSLQTGATSAPLGLDWNPPNATDVNFSTLAWDTSDHGLATVDASGAVTAGSTVTLGGVTVSATIKNLAGDLFTSPQVPITISASATPVSSISAISPSNPAIEVGDQLQLTATVNPDASDQGVEWEVATGGGVVHIDATGLVHADSVGIATVRAKAHGDNSFQTTTQVTVLAILVDTITFTPNTATIAVNGNLDISGRLSFDPPNATNKTVTWTSSDATGKISVSSAGVVHVAPGADPSADILATATDGSGAVGVCTVFVGNPVTAIAISPLSLGLNEGGALSAVTTPPGGSVKWVTAVLGLGTPPTIDPVTGQVTASNAEGTAMVHAESLDGTVISNEVNVTVYDLNSVTTPVPTLGGGEITQGNTLNNSGATMAVDPDSGTVYIAYVDSSQVGYVQKAQGNAWVPVGGNFADDGLNSPPLPVVVDSTTHALNLSLAIDQGIPYIADSDGGSNFQFPIVRRFFGGSWTRVGTGTVNIGAGNFLSLGFDDAHNPFLGFSDQNASVLGRISVALFSGGVWGQIGGNSLGFSNPNSTYSVVAYDASHTLDPNGATTPSKNYYVSYANQGSQAQIANFPAAIVSPSPPETSMTHSDMTIVNGKLYLSYRNSSSGNPTLFTRDSTGVTATHNMDSTTTNAQYTSVAVDPRNGTVYVTYANTSGFLRVSKLDGNAGASASGTVIVSLNDFIVNAIKTKFYVDAGGQGHLYVCYGLSGAGGVLVKDFKR